MTPCHDHQVWNTWQNRVNINNKNSCHLHLFNSIMYCKLDKYNMESSKRRSLFTSLIFILKCFTKSFNLLSKIGCCSGKSYGTGTSKPKLFPRKECFRKYYSYLTVTGMIDRRIAHGIMFFAATFSRHVC